MGVTGGRRPTRTLRLWAVVALSAAFHLGLVAVLVRDMHASRLAMRTPAFRVRLLPPSPRLVPAQAPPGPARPSTLSPRPARDVVEDRGLLGAPVPIAAAPQPPPAAPAAIAPEPAGVGDLRRALRAVGACADEPAVEASEAERAECALRRIKAAPAPFDSARVGSWSAFAAQAELQAARRREREGPMPNAPVEACQGVGSNLGFGCVSGGGGPN
jgi:hypothetical protein